MHVLLELADVYWRVQVAYLLNIRGDDVAHCPVVMAYALVTSEGSTSLFIDQSKLSPAVTAELKV